VSFTHGGRFFVLGGGFARQRILKFTGGHGGVDCCWTFPDFFIFTMKLTSRFPTQKREPRLPNESGNSLRLEIWKTSPKRESFVHTAVCSQILPAQFHAPVMKGSIGNLKKALRRLPVNNKQVDTTSDLWEKEIVNCGATAPPN
jgi:hypothetical protein